MKPALTVRQAPTSDGARFFQSASGAPIAQIPLEAFPDFWAYAYLVLTNDFCVLIDTGSGFGHNNAHLQAGFKQASAEWNLPIKLGDLTHVLVTHGHIDHFGGCTFVAENSSARIGVHELDCLNLTDTESRIAQVSRRLETFLAEAGVEPERVAELVQLYGLTKLNYRPVAVDFTYEAEQMRLGPFEMLHVPGHCAGQVVIRLEDVLFSSDHILAEISPHQAPEQLVPHTGLSHYLHSLDALLQWSPGIRLTLGGHNAPISDLPARIEAIKEVHTQRLTQLLDFFSQPHSVLEASDALFGEVHGYNVLLALEEAGAHVEYLSQRGQIASIIAGPGPIRYQTVER